MRNMEFYRKIGLALLSAILLMVTWISIQTHVNRNISNPNALIHFAITNHTVILIVLIVLSIAYGFLWSIISYHELQKKKHESKGILETVFLFLGKEEKHIIEYLVQNKGTANQADISRLPGMTRVKAFRSLQRMQEKNLINIVAHGKMRKISLTQNIFNALFEK